MISIVKNISGGLKNGGTINLMGKSFKKFGWNAVFVDNDNPEAFRAAVTEKTRAIFVESLANPGGGDCGP